MVGPGQSLVENDFGELPPASIGGYVYYDQNDDGSKTAGEPGIVTTVTLTGANDLGPIAPIAIPTNADGSYNFPGLRPGNYVVTETQPSPYLQGTDTPGSGVASASLSSTDVFAATLAAGDAGVNFNFGEVLPASIAGNVYFDADVSGTLDGGDSPIVSVRGGADRPDDRGHVGDDPRRDRRLGQLLVRRPPARHLHADRDPAGRLQPGRRRRRDRRRA